MTLRLKHALFAGAALAVAGTAHGQTAAGAAGETAESEALSARIEALEAALADLKAELAESRSRSDDTVQRLEARVDAAETAQANRAAEEAAPSKGFQVGDTTVRVGGFVDLDLHVTELSDGAIGANSIARDFHIPPATPVGGEKTQFTDLTAEATRFFLSANRKTGGRNVAAHIELDFLGSMQGDQRVSNSFSPRLRRAYLDVDGVRVGQDWSTFQNTSAIPESASFLVLSDGMVFERQPMVRYTTGPWQFAIENGNATVTPVSGGRVEADSNLLPDLVVRYNLTGAFGNVSFAALGRQLRTDEMAGLSGEEETYGWGLSTGGLLKVGEKDDIRFNLTAGEGLGRYVGLNTLNAAAVNPTDGSLEAITSYGGLIAWRHPFGETARFNVGYSGLFADNPDYLSETTTKQVQSAYGAVLWDVAPAVTMGAELLYGIRELESGADGSITRFTFSTKYAF